MNEVGGRAEGSVVVIGLGGIGGGMAERLVERSHRVVGMDVDAARAGQWGAATGSPSVTTLDDIEWPGVSCVVIAVRTTPQVEAVLSDRGVRSVLDRGAAAFVITTMTPSDARALTSGHPDARLFELPVSGGEVRARRGELTGLVAGPRPSPFEAGLLGDVCATLFTFNVVGQPSLLKLINNTLAARNALYAAVALVTADEEGVDIAVASEVIRASSGASVAGDALGTLSDNQADLLLKDARLLVQELDGSPFDRAPADELTAFVSTARELLSTSERTAP